MVNITEVDGEWIYGGETGIMTQSLFSYTCDQTCTDETNDEFTLAVSYATVDNVGDLPPEDGWTAIGTSGMILRKLKYLFKCFLDLT